MDSEKTLSSKVIYEGKILKLRVDTVLTADGHKSTREIIEHGDCIAVVAIDDSDDVLLVRQYRRAAEKDLLEIPAGGIDPGEDPETAVIREMQEETGFRPQKVERLGGYYLSPGFSSEYLHLYLAANLKHSPLHAEDTPGIGLEPVSVGGIRDLISSGKIEDAKSIAGLLMYLEYRKKTK